MIWERMLTIIALKLIEKGFQYLAKKKGHGEATKSVAKIIQGGQK